MFHKLSRYAWVLGLAAVFIWLTVAFCLPIGLPFLLGFLLALAAEPATGLLQRRLALPREACVALSVSCVCFLTATVLFLLLGFLWRQMQQLAGFLPQLEIALQQGTELLWTWLQRMGQQLPGALGELAAELTDRLFNSGNTFLEQALTLLPKLAAGIFDSLSQWLLALVTGIISAYMIAVRLPALGAWWRSHQPPRWQEVWHPALLKIKKAMGGWLWAEVKLAGIAFAIMLLGFWLLRIQRPLIWAGLITLVDIFPILGVGAVLIPWALVCFLQDNAARGIGILAVYAVVWLTRSVLEPKLIGKGLGLDPLVTLIAIYAGWKLMGILGLLLAPLLALAVTQLVKQLDI